MTDPSTNTAARAPAWIPWAAGVSLLVLFAGVTALLTWQLRTETRAQLLGRDAAILAAATRLEYERSVLDTPGDFGLAETDGQADEALAQALHILPGVRRVTVHDETGRPTAGWPPGGPAPAPLTAAELATLGGPPAGELVEGPGGPVLRALAPLSFPGQERPVGAVAFELDGAELAAELRRLDANLWRQAALVVGVFGVVAGAVLALAFARLERAARALAERGERLARANAELALAAKTSAVGAVAAHLLHGLKNPLAGLRSFVAGAPEGAEAEDWREARSALNRMQAMIGEVAELLQDGDGAQTDGLTLPEVAELLARKAEPRAAALGVALRLGDFPDRTLPGTAGHLVLLILTNLVENALEASPRGAVVMCWAEAPADGGLRVLVADEGPGLPPVVRQRLGQPVPSGKEGGSGLGLSLSVALARHLGARLTVSPAEQRGTTFALGLPPPGG